MGDESDIPACETRPTKYHVSYLNGYGPVQISCPSVLEYQAMRAEPGNFLLHYRIASFVCIVMSMNSGLTPPTKAAWISPGAGDRVQLNCLKTQGPRKWYLIIGIVRSPVRTLLVHGLRLKRPRYHPRRGRHWPAKYSLLAG